LEALAQSAPNFLGSNLSQLRECCVFIREREAIRAPRFGIWINFGWLNESAVNLKAVAPPNADYLKRRRMLVALPRLPINRETALAINLLVVESVTPKPGWQRLVEVPFFTPSLGRSARF
jgi:hypothetical protein